MVRLNMIVEGQTEETFVRDVLRVHLGGLGIAATARSVETGRKKIKRARRKTERIYRGGVLEFSKARKDIVLWMKQDDNPDAFFTTMFDLYALPEDFPGFAEASRKSTPYERVAVLEESLKVDIGHLRFIPYIQLHEFESIVLSDPAALGTYFVSFEQEIKALAKTCAAFQSPELIDDNEATAPSKRIVQLIPDYAGAKPTAGPILAKRIGISKIRQACPHFNDWLSSLEKLAK